MQQLTRIKISEVKVNLMAKLFKLKATMLLDDSRVTLGKGWGIRPSTFNLY